MRGTVVVTTSGVYGKVLLCKREDQQHQRFPPRTRISDLPVHVGKRPDVMYGPQSRATANVKGRKKKGITTRPSFFHFPRLPAAPANVGASGLCVRKPCGSHPNQVPSLPSRRLPSSYFGGGQPAWTMGRGEGVQARTDPASGQVRNVHHSRRQSGFVPFCAETVDRAGSGSRFHSGGFIHHQQHGLRS